MTLKNAIVYLSQNKHVSQTDAMSKPRSMFSRKELLMSSIKSLFEHFQNIDEQHVIIFHEGDFSPKDQEEVIQGHSNIEFRLIRFQTPPHIDLPKVMESINNPPVPFWRNLGYRHMCRFWSRIVFELLQDEFDNIMRLDDDSLIMEPVTDLFKLLRSSNKTYMYRLLQKGEKYDVSKGFIEACNTFSYGQKVPQNMNEWDVVFNNCFVARMDLFRRKDVQDFIRMMDNTGGIYYHRWGDALIHTAILYKFLLPEETEQLSFIYSKWCIVFGKERIYRL